LQIFASCGISSYCPGVWRRCKILLTYLVPALLLAAFWVVWVCKWNQWDSVTYLTVVPFWLLAVPAILVALTALLLIRSWYCWVVFLLWLVTALFATTETRGLWRALAADSKKAPVPVAGQTAIRLVSINCHNGNLRAANEAAKMTPDIILLQEAPELRHLEELTRRIFGEKGKFVASASNAILARGEFLTKAFDETTPTVHARLKLENGALLDLSNVQLTPLLPQAGVLWEEVRRKLTLTRIKNRKSVRSFITGYLSDAHQPIRIVAGDFATPPGDDVFRPLKEAGLGDAFEKTGLGIGNTYPEKFPLFRLNSIWVSSEMRLLRTYTQANEHSDHRIVVCDMVVPVALPK
jgi:endonuclease/exonuclease/phosphatase (EEP) superfamily protein YafD